MFDVYLGLGSNLGDRAGYLHSALRLIGELSGCQVIDISPTYETPPMGPQDQGAFLNLAARIQTTADPQLLIASLQKIERDLGRLARDHRPHWGPREIDIDVLLYADQVISLPGLVVPHPGMHERWFVLKPLSDIAPQVIHPLLKKSISSLLAELDAMASQEALR